MAAPENRWQAFEKMVARIAETHQENPRWSQQYQQMALVIMKARNESMERRRQILTQSQREIQQIQEDVRRNRADTQDRVAQKWDEYIRDEDVVADPFSPGGRRNISNQSNHAWGNSDGEVIYTDGDFNPNESPVFNGREWRSMR